MAAAVAGSYDCALLSVLHWLQPALIQTCCGMHACACASMLVHARALHCLCGFELAATLLQTDFRKHRVVVAVGSVGCRLCLVCMGCQSMKNSFERRQSTKLCCCRRMKLMRCCSRSAWGAMYCACISVCLCGHVSSVGVKFRVKVMAEGIRGVCVVTLCSC